jgi:ABC-2 type transport system ATP-binding protein
MNGWGLREVSVWQERKLALDRVSLQVPAGQVTAVVGGDGAGKTTLLRCLAGAQAPGSGQVSTPGVRQIGYLSSSSGVYPDLTVAENLAFRAAAYGLAAGAAREQAHEYLDRAGLAAARDRLGGQLSGGMRQKLGMIMAMVHRPQLLVLDEPTTGVDPVSRSDLWWLIARAAAAGAAVVIATTYLDEAERATVILALDDGRELAMGTPEEIVAALPGTLRAIDARPDGEQGRRAWRRGGRWRVWDPSAPAAGDPVTSPVTPGPGARNGLQPAGPSDNLIQPDLQDAVTIAALAREFQPAGRTS